MEALPIHNLSTSETVEIGSPIFPGDDVTASDITMVLSVRIHAENLWLLDRIDLMGEYYNPCPRVVIVDFGSDEEFSAKIADVCTRRGYTLVPVPDFDVFSLSMSRNIGFENSKSEFIFFCDPDFFGERDMFERLAETATALDMRRTIDVVLNIPAYHLSRSDTDGFFQKKSNDAKSSHLRSLGWKLNYSKFDRAEESFIAPYSNVFLIHRSMFSLVGGYDTNFRGHGSEDFEFLLRLSMHATYLPTPTTPASDLYGPLSPEFFTSRPYAGFRRLFELMSQPTESLGFKVFHLWHERNRKADWYTNNDWKREQFQKSTSVYVEKPHELLGVDHLERRRRAYCICKNRETWGYFSPLRLAGFELLPIFSDDQEALAAAAKGLVDGDVDALAVFNPYMTSQAAFSSLMVTARDLGRDLIVIERGALPASIYYNEDVCYNSEAFEQPAFEAASFTASELSCASIYIQDLRRGNQTLESMDSYQATEATHLGLKHANKKICFVPLQLEEDMAVTMFVKGEQSYSDFVDNLPDLVDRHQDMIFIVKPHPLSKRDPIRPRPNLIVADRSDNVHFLLDVADLTLCYNSGVGLLSLLHQTPTVTLGNAFYNLSGIGHRASSAAAGITAFLAGDVPTPQTATVERLAAWFLYRKYSFFSAVDDVREHAERRSHGYRDIAITQFRWKEHSIELGRLKTTLPFSWSSYAASRIAPVPESESNSAPQGPDWHRLEDWARKDFRLGNYAKSSALFIRAYKANPAATNLLRCAAESLLREGRRGEAVGQLREFCRLLPHNKRAKMRLRTMRFPWLALFIGRNEYQITE